MRNNLILSLASFVLAVFLLSQVSAIVISSADSDNIAPGQEGKLTIVLKNNNNQDLEDVSLSLDFSNLPLSAKGSSEETLDEFNEDDRESFVFTIRADVSAKPADYKIPYIISYKNASSLQKGTVSVRVSASPDMEFSSSVQNPIVGQKGKITLKLTNKGLGEARFISVKLIPEGFTLLSEDSAYISSIDSNDFDTASFDVIFKNKFSSLTADVTYRDLDNEQYSKHADIPLTVYTQEDAVKQGIIKKSNTFFYILVLLIIVVVWFIWRTIRKRKRLQKSREAMNKGR